MLHGAVLLCIRMDRRAVRPGGGVETERPLCLLDGEDSWMRDVLRPIVEAAGYRTAFAGEAGEVSGAVARLIADRGEGEAEAASAGAPVIRLRATPDAPPDSPGSVYRYDRGALIAALAAARGGK